MDLAHIRNFSIIAHIDHGKSTLADRLLEVTRTVAKRDMAEQYLDSMDLERERGITIKAHPIRMLYIDAGGVEYELNLLDTPGHVDFSYEVSRSVAACEGALLVVDATQGIQAQTLANVYLAMEHDLTLIPVVNKIDLPGAEPERVAQEISDAFGFLRSEVLLISAKTGIGIPEVLEAIVRVVPPPKGDPDAPLRALIFDSKYDSYKGVIASCRVVDGSMRAGQKLLMMSTGKAVDPLEVGAFRPSFVALPALEAGEVGYVATGLKAVEDSRVGDTITDFANPATQALPGYRELKPMVFAGLFPVEGDDYLLLRDALEKLKLNDAALQFEPESSAALGFGFRCGFLGLLHLEIVLERLSREFDLDLITTAPSVVYKLHMSDGSLQDLHNPVDMPEPTRITAIEEPWIRATIMVPDDYLGAVLSLCTDRRGEQLDLTYVGNRAMAIYRLPLNEVVYDFYDRLKSVSRGYASFDYQMDDYAEGDLVKVDILVNAEPVDALSMVVPRSSAEARGRQICERLKDLIPRQLFKIPIQAAIGGKVIARETISAMRKDVTAKCYGGDVTRKRKLLDKQKKGKKRMRQFGKVEIPQTAFIEALRMNDE